MPVALIIGVDGQDGSYLAEFLLARGYRVTGSVPPVDTVNLDRIRHLLGVIDLVTTDLLDQEGLEQLIAKLLPDEIYNLAAHSFLSDSFRQPVLTGETAALGVTRILEAIRATCPRTRFFQASSSEIFGTPTEVPQSETTPFHPRNPYGVAKVYGHLITINYRESYGLFAGSGILYNHESPRRSLVFVTRKITHGAAQIKLGLAKELRLGNLEARRDWGFAGDFVRGMWLMLQQPAPDDYVLATGETHSVRELCETAFAHLGLNYRDYVVQDSESYRPLDAAQLVGNPAKANRILGWKPEVPFHDLVRMMVEADLKGLRDDPDRSSAQTGRR